MIEIGQAVYFIESRGLDPVIKFLMIMNLLWQISLISMPKKV